MFYFNALNLNQISGGNQVKQGDFGSTFAYNLADEKSRELDVFDQKTAYVNLVLDNNIVFTTTVIVDDSTVTFHIDKAIPTGLYFLEIKIDSYIFPSDRQTIILVTAGAVAYDLKDLIPNYDTNMTITGILSDLSQKGIDISDLKTKIAKNINDISTMQPEISDLQNNVTNLQISKADKSFVDSKFASIVSGAPKGTFATLAALQTAYPSGTEGVFLVFENGHWYYYASGWKDGGVYQATGIADGAVGTTKYADGSFNRKKSKTSLASMQDGMYFNTNAYYMTRNGTDIKIKFPESTVAYYKNIEQRDVITLSVLEYMIPHNYSLVYSITDKTQFFIKNTDTLTVNDYILISNHFGIDKINKIRKYQEHFNDIIFTTAKVTYQAISSSEVNVVFSGDLRLFLRTSDGLNLSITIPQNTYTLSSSNALVFNLYTQTITTRHWDGLLPDDVVLIGNYNTKVIQNNIGAIPIKQDFKYSRIFEDDIIYYAGKVTISSSGSSLILNFSDGDTRLFYKILDGNFSATLSTLQYTVPHNSSLVLNIETKTMEIVNSDSVIRGLHWVLVSCHQGLPKKLGIRVENSVNSQLPVSARTPIQLYDFLVNQDGCVVEDEVWMFDGGSSDHTGTANIHRLNKDTLVELGTIPHNLGHANGVDYKNGKLVVFNGGAYPPEICLYDNPFGKTSLNLSDLANTQIIFKEGTKQLEGDGSACFGENERIVLYASNTKIYKILLGMGDNNLSDITADKSDMTSWGTFQSGKTESQYNGTAKIIGTYKGYLGSVSQSQGLAYDGHLYLATGYDTNHAFKIQLRNDGTFQIIDDYKYNYSNYKNETNTIEPEAVFIIDNYIFVGGRNGTDSFIVKFRL